MGHKSTKLKSAVESLKQKVPIMASDDKTEYLTEAELDDVVPEGKRVKKLRNMDRRYEHYYVGHTPPEIAAADLNGGRAQYWYDLSLDRVRLYDPETAAWKIASKDTPKLALQVSTHTIVGQVDEDNELATAPRGVTDLLNEEI